MIETFTTHQYTGADADNYLLDNAVALDNALTELSISTGEEIAHAGGRWACIKTVELNEYLTGSVFQIGLYEATVTVTQSTVPVTQSTTEVTWQLVDAIWGLLGDTDDHWCIRDFPIFPR